MTQVQKFKVARILSRLKQVHPLKVRRMEREAQRQVRELELLADIDIALRYAALQQRAAAHNLAACAYAPRASPVIH